MLHRVRTTFAILVTLLATLNAGCSDDATKPVDIKISAMVPPGEYAIALDISPCPATPAYAAGVETWDFVACRSVSWADLLDISDCLVQSDGDSIWIDCTYTEDDGSCATTFRVIATGKRVGDTWTITGSQTIGSDSPAGCSVDPDCQTIAVTLTGLAAGIPTACAWGDAQTITATIDRGLLAGDRSFLAGGFVTLGSSGWSWNISAIYPGVPGYAANGADLSLILPETGDQSLPQDIDIGFNVPGLANMEYSEVYTNGGSFVMQSVDSGTVTIEEISERHVAGTFTVAMAGLLFSQGGQPAPDKRVMTALFHVRDLNTRPVLQPAQWPGYREAYRRVSERRRSTEPPRSRPVR